MSIRAFYSVENVLHYSIPLSNHLLNKAFKLLRYLSLYYLNNTEAYLKFMKHWFSFDERCITND